LLLEMIEDDLNLREPVNFKRYLILTWLLIGGWVFYKDFKGYYQKMSQPKADIDYTMSALTIIR
jgi:hypothetical protein